MNVAVSPQVWVEDVAHAVVRERFERIGDGGAEAWAFLNTPLGCKLLERYGEAVIAALEAESWELLNVAWTTFRRDFSNSWRPQDAPPPEDDYLDI